MDKNTKSKKYDRFIDLIKDNESLVYNKDVADLLGIDPRNLASYKNRGVPKSWIQWYCSKYKITPKSLLLILDGKPGIQKGNKEPRVDKMKDEFIDLLKEKVAFLSNKLSDAEKGKYQKKYPESFGAMVDLVESAQSLWEWNFTASPTPMSLADNKGIILNVNKALLNRLGWSKSEMVGKPFVDFIHPDDVGGALKEMAKEDRNYKTRALRFDGEYCKVHIKAKSFITKQAKFSVATIECVDNCCVNH